MSQENPPVRWSVLRTYSKALKQGWNIPAHQLAKMRADALDASIRGVSNQKTLALEVLKLLDGANTVHCETVPGKVMGPSQANSVL